MPEGNIVGTGRNLARPRPARRHGRLAALSLLATLAVLAGSAATCRSADQLLLTIVNTSTTPDDQVYVMLTGNDVVQSTPATPIDTSVPLTSLTPVAGSAHTYSFVLEKGITAGLIWLSFGAPVSNHPRPDVNTSTTRFANVELAFPGQADLTNVDQFSVPLRLATLDAGGVEQQVTSYSSSTDCIVAAMQRQAAAVGANIQPAVKTADGRFLRVISPSHLPSAWPSMAPYLASLRGQTITVSGHFGNDLYPSQSGWYRYAGRFDPSTGAMVLTGTIGAATPDGTGGRAGLAFTASAADLTGGVYSQAGTYHVPGDPVPNRPPSPNDVYGSIYRDLIAGFAWGYWGGTYGNDNTAFTGRAPFAAARPVGEAFPAYSIYSDVLWQFTTAYSMPYGESYGSGGHPSPLLDIPLGTSELRVTILPDTASGGCP